MDAMGAGRIFFFDFQGKPEWPEGPAVQFSRRLNGPSGNNNRTEMQATLLSRL
jgi:hypothetical protein